MIGQWSPGSCDVATVAWP